MKTVETEKQENVGPKKLKIHIYINYSAKNIMQQKFFSLMEGLVRIPSNKRRVSRAVGALATEDRAVSSPSAVWSAAESRTDARLWVQ